MQLTHNTCFPIGEGWRYLSSVLELGSRRLIGLKPDNIATPLVADPRAIHLRGAARGVIFHSFRWIAVLKRYL